MSVINAGTQSIQFWDEVGDAGNATGTFENGSSGITQTIRVAFSDQAQAIRDILGTQALTIPKAGAAPSDVAAAKNTINRSPPLQHSIYPAYYATRVNLLGGKQADGKYVGNNSTNDVAKFTWVLLQIQYTTLPFSIGYSTTLAQGSPGGEFARYVSNIPQPGVEFLKVGNLQNGTYKYVTNAVGPTVPGPSTTVPFGMTVRLQKTTLQYKWWWVPHDFVFGGGDVPTNIINGIGCVNQNAWPAFGGTGFPIGSLLAMPPQFEAINSPEPSGGPNRLYNITFNFINFQPPFNAADTQPGHNAAPFNDGNYYKVQTVNGGKPLYPAYDFNLFFTGV